MEAVTTELRFSLEDLREVDSAGLESTVEAVHSVAGILGGVRFVLYKPLSPTPYYVSIRESG